jgi:sugar phosphate isomerase/epimerase
MYFTSQKFQIPKLVAPNLITDPVKMRDFAITHGFDGIDWSFNLDTLPLTSAEESQWAARQKILKPLEVRYHCPFIHVDIGHEDKDCQTYAMNVFRRIIRLVSQARQKYVSIHVGLGHDTTKILSWEATIRNLRELVQYGHELGVTVALENLIWGWSSKPNLFEKLVRRTGAHVTIDIGHAKACESVQSQAYNFLDFISPHADKVINAHIYDYEVPGVGHILPDRVEDIADRLNLLMQTACRWWVLEIREANELIRTKNIVDAYLCGLFEHIEDVGRCDRQYTA